MVAYSEVEASSGGLQLTDCPSLAHFLQFVATSLMPTVDLHKPHDVRQLGGVSNPASEAYKLH